jgi:molybdenum cofactor cytidylyltransferase
MIAGAILAAGASCRMGRPKALMPIGSAGECFLTRLAATLCTAELEELVVVVGHHAAAIRQVVTQARLRAHVTENPSPARGQLSSLVVALDAIDRPELEALLVVPVDMPLISPRTVSAVVEAYRRTRGPVVRPACDSRHGHPVIFDRSVFGELRGADPAVGARAVTHAHPLSVVDVPLDDPGAFEDIDTPEDYERILGQISGQ